MFLKEQAVNMKIVMNPLRNPLETLSAQNLITLGSLKSEYWQEIEASPENGVHELRR